MTRTEQLHQTLRTLTKARTLVTDDYDEELSEVLAWIDGAVHATILARAKDSVRRYESKRKAEAEPKCPRCGGETDPAWECSEGYCPECCQATDVGG